MLNVYHNYKAGNFADEDFAAILDVLETFLIRRFVCNVPTHGLNRIFASLYSQTMRGGSLLEGLKQSLRDKNFPNDREFQEKFATCKIYGGGERLAKAKLILERLELSFDHKEMIDPTALTIEHVMPQTPTEWWKQELGDDWETTHDTWLDTIGNLTLTGYNPELSNSDFNTKKGILQKSHVELSKYFACVDTWDEQAISRRGEELAERAMRIWPDFSDQDNGSDVVAVADEDEQEDVNLLIAKVIEHFGGAVEKLGNGHRYLYKVGDGKIINIKYSKRHSNYYWFGVHASLLEEMIKAGATHMMFIVSQQGFLAIPLPIVKEYLNEANVSCKTDGTVRHYHALISLEPNLEFFHHGKLSRIPLKQYYVKFNI